LKPGRAPAQRVETMAPEGFAIRAAVFTAAEMTTFSACIAGLELARSRAGVRHLLRFDAVARLAHDPRLLELAAEWLGRSAIPFKATLFDKSADANWLVAWHQDTALPIESRAELAGWGPWSEKHGITHAHAPAPVLEKIVALRIHLDDSHAENGPLRVLPGTHQLGVLSDTEVMEQARRIEPAECLALAGDVLAMRPLIIHASSKVRVDAPRRVLHIEYAGSLNLENGLKLRPA
jgi:ectoine hydroxylase-related dioxygenase (phytanoyl-CoA dioxygenase family)